MKTKNLPINPKAKCPVCLKNPALTNPLMPGVFPCGQCQARRANNSLPDNPVEMTSASIKEGRKAYAKSALQPWRQHEPSKEFIEAYPDIAKQTFSEKEIKHAKNVWSDIPSLRNWRNTK